MRFDVPGVVRLGVVAAALAGGCAADEMDSDDWDERLEVEEIAVAGRWIPSASATAAGNHQTVRYDDAPSWSGGRHCGGNFLPGARELGDYLRANFRGVSSYSGYACRPNTANTSQMSMHGTGRAIDVFIPLSRAQADNTLGDAVANWLVANASALGVQLVIWDRSSWNASRPAGSKLRGYGGPHPHHDHLHVELNADGAARRTAWFRDRAAASPPGGTSRPETPPPPPPGGVAPRMRVNVASLNLRRGPSSTEAIIASMPCGAAVTVLGGPSSGWYDVAYGSSRGWASGNFLLPEASFQASVCGR